MQLFTIFRTFSSKYNIVLASTSKLHTSSALCVGAKWRREQKIPIHGIEDGQMVDGLDWSYTDDKPVPLNPGRKKRALQQIDICKKIIALTKEVDFIVEDFAEANQNAMRVKQKLLERKLKPKGDLLHSRNNNK